MSCKAVLDKIEDLDPWFGIEQEFVILGPDNEILDKNQGRELGKDIIKSKLLFILNQPFGFTDFVV